jgi:hypothetical protein
MTRPKKKPARAKLLRSLFIWHRYIGLTSALFVILLTLTGLLLNHTEDLALDSRHVQSAILLDWYGVKAPEAMPTYTAGSSTITEVGTQIYWNTTPIPQASSPLLGIVETHGQVIIGIEGQLILFTPNGELIERLDSAAGVPAGMQALGRNAAGDLVLKTPLGLYQTDRDILKWHETSDAAITWAVPAAPSTALRAALQQVYRGTGLSLERVLLDIHSGRILGSKGVYFVDAAALLFLLLASSGVLLWGKHHANAREHRRNKQQHTDA